MFIDDLLTLFPCDLCDLCDLCDPDSRSRCHWSPYLLSMYDGADHVIVVIFAPHIKVSILVCGFANMLKTTNNVVGRL